jgi:putative peptidoglycan binding protein
MRIRQSPPGFHGVRGPLVQAVQKRLNGQGFDAGTEDGEWGGRTLAALKKWQQAHGLSGTGEIDDQTWIQLMTTPVPELSRRALQLTGAWEGTGYSGANGNFDGQGITWGVVGFTWKNGELQGILGEVQRQHPIIFSRAFGALENQMLGILALPRPAQMDFARSISIDNGERIQPQWAAAFKALGEAAEVQDIENTHAQHYWDAGLNLAKSFTLESEAGLALSFDIAVQNTVSDAMVAEIRQKIDNGGMSEPDKMQIVAHVVADHANPHFFNDVLKRKMTFATGQGSVHGDLYDIGCWGIG